MSTAEKVQGGKARKQKQIASVSSGRNKRKQTLPGSSVSSGSNLRSVVVVGAAGNIVDTSSTNEVKAQTQVEMRVLEKTAKSTRSTRPANYKDPRTPEQIAENEQRHKAYLERMKKLAEDNANSGINCGNGVSGKLAIDPKREVEEILSTLKPKYYDKKKLDSVVRVELICLAESKGCHFARVTRESKIYYVIQPPQALSIAVKRATTSAAIVETSTPAVPTPTASTSSTTSTPSEELKVPADFPADSSATALPTVSIVLPAAVIPDIEFKLEEHHVNRFNDIFHCACELATLKEDAKMFGKEKELDIFLTEHILRGSSKGVKSMERTISDKIIADLSINPRYLHLQSVTPSSLDFVLNTSKDAKDNENCADNENCTDVDDSTESKTTTKKKKKDYGEGPFVVVDVVKAVFQAYHNYGIIVEDTWEKFLAKYTSSPLLLVNKQWRMLVFGKLDRGRRNWHLYQAVATELWQTIAIKLPWVKDYLVTVKDDEITFATGGDNADDCHGTNNSSACRGKTLAPTTVAGMIVRDLASIGLPAYAHISSFWKENLPFLKKSAAAKPKSKPKSKPAPKPASSTSTSETDSSSSTSTSSNASTELKDAAVPAYPTNPGFVRHFYSWTSAERDAKEKLFDIKGAKGMQLRVEWISQLTKYAAKKEAEQAKVDDKKLANYSAQTL